MATRDKKRCGVLCQHPGCWQASERVYQRPTDYLNYLNERSKKRRRYDNVSVSKPVALERHSCAVDGLHTLKINNLEHNEIREHRRPNTQSQSMLFSSFTDAEKYPSHSPALNEPKIHRVQILLESDDDDNSLCDNNLMKMTYTPVPCTSVLLWKPGKRNQYSQQALKSPATSLALNKLPTQYRSSSIARSLRRTTTLPLTSSSHVQGSTVNLPLALEGVKKVTELCNVRKDGMRENSVNLVDRSQHTEISTSHQTTRVYSNTNIIAHTYSSTSGTFHFHKDIHNLSTSKLSKANAHSRSYRELKSFSRQLSTNPQEVIHGHRFLRKREASKLLPLDPFEVVEEERIEAEKLSRWPRADNIAPHCNGFPGLSHSMHLPALTINTESLKIPSSHHHNYQAQQIGLTNQFDSSPHAKRIPKINKSNINCICVPTAGKVFPLPHHKITLRLAVDKSKNSGYRSPFCPKLLKRKFTWPPSPCQRFGEDAPSSSHNNMQDLVTCGRKAELSSFCDPTTSLTHSKARHSLVASVSPDYMLMSAKFARGKLILTDKKRVRSVRQLTVSGSETKLVSLGRDFVSSPAADDRLTNSMDSGSSCPPGWITDEGSTSNLSLTSDDVFEEPDDVMEKQGGDHGEG